MLKKIIILFSIILLSFSFSFAKVTNLNIVSSGTGHTKNKAISNALIQAVSQINGVNIKSVTESITKVEEKYTNNKNKSKYKNQFYNNVIESTQGKIKSYRVLDIHQIDNNEYEANIEVTVAKYKAMGESAKKNMYSIVVEPFHLKTYIDDSNNISSKTIKNSIQQALINQFTQSRKFNVLDRNKQDSQAYENEINHILSGDVSGDEQAKIGQQIGADLLLLGNITSFNISKKTTIYYGENFSSWNANITIDYRIIELATMQIKWSNTITIDVPKQLANKLMENNSYSALANYIYKKVAQKISSQIMTVVFPLRILQVSGNYIYINQGGDTIQNGSIFDIKKIIAVEKDPSTGTHIPLMSHIIAKAIVTDVAPKYSVAKIISGNSYKVKKGQLAFLSSKEHN